jgi:sugar phosphate isomerase/epimerase
MLIGAMNHPACDPLAEIQWMADSGLDFVDLTIEPPAAAAWQISPKDIRDKLRDHNLPVVGHTAYYLPIGSPFRSLRKATCEELKTCLEIFAFLGAKWMNIHPDRQQHLHDRDEIIAYNIETFSELLPVARNLGIGIMVENVPVHFNSVEQLSELLDPLPELGLHLDIGHCNLRGSLTGNSYEELIAVYGSRLRHVHLHDNKGGTADLHLPLGTGNVDLAGCVRALKSAGYDETITLEVFSKDHHYLQYSRDVLRKIWDKPELAPKHEPEQAHALSGGWVKA